MSNTHPPGNAPNFWICGQCKTPNPPAVYVTMCVVCGASRALAIPPVEVVRPTRHKQPTPSPIQRLLSQWDRYLLAFSLACLCLTGIILVVIAFGFSVSLWLILSLLLVPVLALVAFCISVRRFGILAINIVSGILLLGITMIADKDSPSVQLEPIALPIVPLKDVLPGFFYAVTDGGRNQGHLLKIELNSGLSIDLGLPKVSTPQDAFEGMEDIVLAPNGILFATGWSHTRTNGTTNHAGLFRIDPKTMTSRFIGVTSDYQYIEGLEFVGDILYGSASTLGNSKGLKPSYSDDISDHLIMIDTKTGEASEVGMFGPKFLNVESLAWSPIHGLIGVDIGTLDPKTEFRTFNTKPALVRIDPFAEDRANLATKIADLPPREVREITNSFYKKPSPEGPYMCGLRFGADGNTLYATTFPTHFGGESRLVTINPKTGEIRDIGPIGAQNVDGIAHIPASPK